MSKVTYPSPERVRSIAVLGAGSIGASWTALFLAHGIDVVAFDPGKDAEAKATAFVRNAWPALRALGVAQESEPPLSKVSFAASAQEAVQSADVIQENLPEISKLKAETMSVIGAATSPTTIILSEHGRNSAEPNAGGLPAS